MLVPSSPLLSSSPPLHSPEPPPHLRMGGSTTTVVVMLIVVLHYYMLLVDGASWDEVSSEADGPAPAEGPDDELWLPRAGPPPRVVNVDDYGAADAGVDAAEAFLAAWSEACNSSAGRSVFLVPEGKAYLLMPVSFRGPCRAASVAAMIKGTLEAPSDRSVWLERGLQEWITFEGVDRLRVLGGGTLDGNGMQWWINSCKLNRSARCVTGPTALYLRRCTRLVVEELQVRDSMQMHVAIAYSRDVAVSRLSITAPAWSPNTDGIHVSNSREVSISRCTIATGDDCVSIVTGSTFVRVTSIFCGPGHGISIGSLGANNSWAHVSDVLVEKATLLGTTNGVRIKTWQGGYGYAERISFRDISMRNVTNPIIIDQNYCDSARTTTPSSCHDQGSAVAVRNISYRNIHGTSASRVAISLVCSAALRCDGIRMQDVYLVGEGRYATCSYRNATVVQSGYTFPFCSAEM
ncbi:polygalacturonase [Zea mays]|uniref:Polygalacturonase n=2 Tax=Zea mays TaxID=4577 RepID=K7VKI0_MAIZE|nr:polygalacturonase [Zea mays]AQL08631.1 Polygalacturonase [Zea mays]